MSPTEDSHQQWHADWVAELDRLELDVTTAERMLAERRSAALGAWELPQLRGPMPEDLVPRARLLHERQLAAVRDLTHRVSSTAQLLAFGRKVRSLVTPDVPVYVDLSA